MTEVIDPHMNQRVSVLVPTWRRPGELVRCLRALSRQTRPANQVVVTVRDDDHATLRAIAAMNSANSIEIVVVPPGPLTAAMNAGLGRTDGDIVALTDDDAEPRPDWVERLLGAFSGPDVGGVGGRDWQPRERWDEPRVGTISWFGRVVGNHHLGCGPARDVDVLKGVNCAFRGQVLRDIGFDRRLRGRGNVSHWEMSLCFALRRRGFRLIYDPAIAVDHHVAARHDGDVNARGGFDRDSFVASVHNDTLAVLEHLPAAGRATFVAWSLLVGTRDAPGVAQVVRLAPRSGAGHVLRRAKAVLCGRRAGLGTYLQSRDGHR